MHIERTIQRKIARIFERDAFRWPTRGARSLVKSIELPRHAHVIGVGGATIGGSGKTPLAIAIVRALAERGHRAVFVAHGYGAHVGHARRVSPNDEAATVGDESIVAARALGALAPVVVASARAEAIELAAQLGDTLVVDHLHQTRPRPLDRAVLAIDDHAPWGSNRPFPLGDLVQSPDALLACSDVVVRIGSLDARSMITLDFQAKRVGLITSVARPDRIVRALSALGVAPIVHLERADHAPIDASELRRITVLATRHRIDLWLADAKSHVWIGDRAGAPIVPLRHRIELSPSLVDRLARTC